MKKPSTMPAGASGLPMIGAHFSTAGGLQNALEEAARLRCGVAQIFTSSPRQWQAPPIAPEEAALFIETRRKTGVLPVSHAVYLINLAGVGEGGDKSLNAFTEELVRCQTLDIPYLVIHPGSAGEMSIPRAARIVAERLDAALDASRNTRTTILLETTAGMGHSIGHRFDQLAAILNRSGHDTQLGVCLDTAHIFAAGYDLRSAETYDAAFHAFEQALPLARLRLFHINDSATELHSQVDRHAHLGQGHLGLDPFRRLLEDPRFFHTPKCLETADDEGRPEDIRLLHEFLPKTIPAPEPAHESARTRRPRTRPTRTRRA